MHKLVRIQDGVPRHPDWRMSAPINLEICEGEQVAIVGANAAGKSRLVEVLLGHYPLLRQEVEYDFGPAERRLVSENVKYVSFRDSYGEQDTTYYYQQRWNQHDIADDMPTVREALGLSGGQSLASGEGDFAAIESLDILHNDSLLDKHLVTLSSGEMRKFQLTRALLHRPRILILDNPFIGLDADTRRQLGEVLAHLACETAITLILVLSRPEEIPAFVSHILPVEGVCLLPKVTREEYLKDMKTESDTASYREALEWIMRLPAKTLTAESFYPHQGGEILRFNHVSIRYGERTILRNLDWTVNEGERWALSGANGSGKSTLLSLVCADNPQAYACDIRLFGHRRGSGESIWDIKRHIGYVSPEMHRAYMKNLPAIDIVASGLSDSVGLYKRPRPAEREVCLGWMRVFGIDHLADRAFLRLSSGEQRLCLLARAFVKDPELLILDEPLHGLDPANRARAKAVIETFCRRPQKTLVMVSHYEDELPSCITHRLRLQRER
ncbi:MAG: ATP-binding cassette domain-containing protein [Bacteroidaceae bacterium]|nr:ATP-binding cassette domain-containing protein [Bacteroidaceae bacterium]